jgi:hypothetical protein
MVHAHSRFAKPMHCIPRTSCEPYGAHACWAGETRVLHFQNEMRTPWRTVILGCRNLGFAFPERDAIPLAHTHSALPKPMFCTPSTRWESFGAHSFWAGETYVLISERHANPMGCTLVLGWINLVFAFPTRDANPMSQTHSVSPKLEFCQRRATVGPYGTHSFWVSEKPRIWITRTRCQPYGAHSSWVGRAQGFAFSNRDANPMLETHSVFAKPMFCIRRARCGPYDAHSFCVSEKHRICIPSRDASPMVHTHFWFSKPRFCSHRTRREPYGAHSVWVGET